MTKKLKAFEELHSDCEQTWVQPNADMSMEAHDRAKWWWHNGERGMSSEIIWKFFMKNCIGRMTHPHDPDDFRRCSELFSVMPEWKERVTELMVLSPVWFNLASNWDKLEEMLLDLKEKGTDNGMYDYMQTLLTEGNAQIHI